MTDVRWWFDLVSAAVVVAMASVGIVLRVRRTIRLHRIILPDPHDASDRDYLATVKRSTYLRLMVKVVFLIGGLLMLLDVPWLWVFWRVGIVAALAFMLSETRSVDLIRTRLGRHREQPS